MLFVGYFISHSPRCCCYVRSLLLSFCVDIIKGDDALTEISFFEAKWEKQKLIWIYQYTDIQPGETDANAYIPIWIRGYEHVASVVRWNRLYINTKIYYPAYWASPPIAILFPYKHPARNKYVTLKTSFIQATHFQCCHNYLKSMGLGVNFK